MKILAIFYLLTLLIWVHFLADLTEDAEETTSCYYDCSELVSDGGSDCLGSNDLNYCVQTCQDLSLRAGVCKAVLDPNVN